MSTCDREIQILMLRFSQTKSSTGFELDRMRCERSRGSYFIKHFFFAFHFYYYLGNLSDIHKSHHTLSICTRHVLCYLSAVRVNILCYLNQLKFVIIIRLQRFQIYICFPGWNFPSERMRVGVIHSHVGSRFSGYESNESLTIQKENWRLEFKYNIICGLTP